MKPRRISLGDQGAQIVWDVERGAPDLPAGGTATVEASPPSGAPVVYSATLEARRIVLTTTAAQLAQAGVWRLRPRVQATGVDLRLPRSDPLLVVP